MNRLTLKILVVIAMIAGNASLYFVDGEKYYFVFTSMRILGTMIIPVITFLMVEGYYHSTNRKMYFVRLAAFAFAAESAYLYYTNMVMDKIDKAISANIASMTAAGEKVVDMSSKDFSYEKAIADIGHKLGTTAQNYYATLYDSANILYFSCGLMSLTAGFLLICCIGIYRKKFAEKRTSFAIVTILTVLGFALFTAFSEASTEILVYSLIFYFFREKKSAKTVVSFMAAVILLPFSGMVYIVGAAIGSFLVMLYKEEKAEPEKPKTKQEMFKERTGMAKKKKADADRYVKIPGRMNKWLRIAFYAAYPLHYIVFCMIIYFGK